MVLSQSFCLLEESQRVKLIRGFWWNLDFSTNEDFYTAQGSSPKYKIPWWIRHGACLMTSFCPEDTKLWNQPPLRRVKLGRWSWVGVRGGGACRMKTHKWHRCVRENKLQPTQHWTSVMPFVRTNVTKVENLNFGLRCYQLHASCTHIGTPVFICFPNNFWENNESTNLPSFGPDLQKHLTALNSENSQRGTRMKDSSASPNQ